MHPAARVSSERTVDAITRDQLVAFHRNFVRPDSTILSISGHRHVPIRLKDGGFGLVTIRQILRFIHDTVEQVGKKETEIK